MRDLLRKILAGLICISGIHILVRELFCRNQVGILMYHDVKPSVFETHIAYLSKNYNVISLDTLVSSLHEKDFSEIPIKSVVITIDDGHVGNFDLLPIFKQYQIRPTVYVCTKIINTYRHFWFKIHGQSKSTREMLKTIDNSERLTYLKKSDNYEPEKLYPDRQALNIAEIRQMLDYVDFQPHTQYHPILPNCTEQECKQEILGSKMDLENMLGSECIHFNYPNGDYTEREIGIVKEGGFRSARTVDIGWNTLETCTYRLKTVPIADDAGLTLFRAQLTTIPQRINYLLNTLFKR